MKPGKFSISLSILAIIFSSTSAQVPSNRAGAIEEIAKEETENHRPGAGFLLIEKPKGTLTFSVMASLRYLNSQALKDSFTNSFGRTYAIDKRNDLQFQKVMLYFKGWLFDPKFRYLTYVWTANTNLGLGAQVVAGGNFQYMINKHFDVGAGIGGLPTNRSMVGQWPFWHRQDVRPMGDEYFRGSFTTGIWVQGEIVKGLNYKTMLGNNLSQLGVDAGQLDGGFDSWSTSITWATNKYSDLGTYSDFEHHEKPATFLGTAFTRSNETRQSQPGKEDPENTQLRLSDGTAIFDVNAFGPNTQVIEAKYQMASVFGGLKYKGFALDLDYFVRWINVQEAIGTLPTSSFRDDGFTVQASAMLLPKSLTMYGIASYINGEYGKPSEYNLGFDWFPFKSRSLRFNPEIIFTNNSPVGYLSYPTVVGANGTIFMANIELFF